MFFQKKEEKEKPEFDWLQHGVAVFFIFLLLLSASYFGFSNAYKTKILPKTSIAGMEIGGMRKKELKEMLNEKVNQVNESGVKFTFKDKETVINPIVSSFEGDIAFSIINFNVDKAVDKAFSIGRRGSFLENFSAKINSLFYKTELEMDLSMEEEQITKILEENYKNIEKNAVDAGLVATTTWKNSWQKEITFEVTPEEAGFELEYEKAVKILKDQLVNFDLSPIEIKAKQDLPEIHKSDVLNVKNKAQEILEKAPLALIYEDERWTVEAKTLSSWLGLKKGINNLIMIGLKDEKIEEYLEENVAPAIEREPEDAKLEIKEGRVMEFQTSKDGIELSPVKTISKIKNEFLVGTSTEIEIITNKLESQIKTENVNDLGIKEIIGTGHSNFAGSPSNRIHNINNGAESISGILIKPDEEFSLIEALGDINAETGYLPELVIKGNRTIPEYGGGLCQIGTTIFRTALQSGLPITARRNHSYRVSYYEPAGTDATIYDPWPDMKFLNDTGNHILIQHRIDGNDLYFDFWGTNDGRKIEVTDPTIYNIVPPGPTKMVETTDLEPGEKKCTESAHAGADAYFDYTVAYPDGEIKEERFSSHYVPWRAVCLVGAEKTEVEKENVATSTPEKEE